MKKLIASLFLFLLLFNNVYACLNGNTRDTKDGTVLYEDGEKQTVPHGHIFRGEGLYIRTLDKLDRKYIETKDLDYLSDKGLVLILLKRYDEAIELYLKIEKIKPNLYSTASNIGTAYELAGQNENALKWIKKAVRINPRSHENSEWIHVNILEAKIKGEEFYTSDFLLKTDFGSEKLPKSSINSNKLNDLRNALYYQLNERISFVKPKEVIVAQLLFDLGNINYLLGDYSSAVGNYNKAKSYGYSGSLIETRLREGYLKTGEEIAEHPIVKETVGKLNLLQKKEPKPKSAYLTYGLVGVTICLLAFVMYRRAKR